MNVERIRMRSVTEVEVSQAPGLSFCVASSPPPVSAPYFFNISEEVFNKRNSDESDGNWRFDSFPEKAK